MASNRPKNGGTSRLVPPAVDSARNPSSKLPARPANPITSTSTGIPTFSTTRLTKRRPSTGKGAESVPLATRSPSVNGIRRLVGQELRREMEQPALPVQARRTNISPGKSKPQRGARIIGSEPARTPSLVSGSSVSTMDSPRSTRLRRKRSNIGTQNIRTSPDSTSSREGMDPPGSDYKDPYPDAVLGIAMPPVPSSYTKDHHHDEIINLDQYVLTHSNLATADLPPPTPLYAMSSTPSTGYSPGPFSISSTPTSMSSASPGIVITSASRTKQPSPTRSRPPVSRKLTDETTLSGDSRGLPSVRESSSSSTSTLRGGEFTRSRDKARISPMPALSPSPPPQKTSHHRRGSSDNKSVRNGATSTSKRQVPPELAHLVDPSPRKGSAGSVRPTRPSRDGAPEIAVQEKSPVIQSNMSSLPTALHKRQSSSEVKSRAVAPLTIDIGRSRFGVPRGRGVSPSPSQSSALSPTTAGPPNRGFTPDLQSESEASIRVRSSPQVESKSFARFGFFSKKNKSEVNTASTQKEKKPKKGPSAGTGHEGYGRFAFRGRSGSTTSGSGNTSTGRSPSADSAIGNAIPSSRKSSIGSNKGSDIEDFLAERANPITIRGGQATRPAVNRSQTEATYGCEDAARDFGFVAPPSDNSTALELPKRPVLLPSPMSDPLISGSPVKRQTTVAAQKEDKSSLPSISSLTSRRASRRSFLGGKALASLSRTELQSANGSSTRDGSTRRQNTEPNRYINGIPEESLGPTRAQTEPQVSLKPPSKWNFLQRARSPVRKTLPVQESEQNSAIHYMAHRSVAHYAMGDAPPAIDAEELAKIMQEAETTPDDGSNSETERKIRARGKGKAPIRHGNSILLPAPPRLPAFAGSLRPASPKVTLNASPAVQSPPQLAQSPPQEATSPPPFSTIAIVGQPRPSRLPQVGRIPRVVSKRDRERKLSDVSFSRPFMPTQPSPALKNGPLPRIPGVASPELVKARLHGLSDLALAPAYKGLESPPDNLASSPYYSPPIEFMTFPPRKDSEQSTTSSSSGFFNIMATTAVIPAPGAPPLEDEVWSEYDDMLDMLSTKTPKTPKTPMTGSSFGAPFHYAELSPKDGVAIQRPSTAPSASTDPPQEILPQLPQVPTVASFAQRIRIPSLHDSRVVSSLPSAGTPNSAFRMSEFVAGYGERNMSIIDPVSGRLSLPSQGRLSTSTNGRFSLPSTIRPQSTQTKHARNTSNTASDSNRSDSRSMERAETEYMGFENLANLRFGALMTSKWLSFGRVLFSPAHTELKARGEHRLLIIDGLGKDWSFYVALNYPNAFVYNLGTEPGDAATDTASPIQSLPNHRHIQHPSLIAPFPFPKGFFSAVVFRFPIATTESTYKTAVFECKRVLRPGGYLEISILDMDMMNMGSRARSALRGLKMQMQAEDPNISLKPLSDSIQRLLYRRGFENLNRCLVAVPAAGRIPGSRDEGSEEPNSASVESSTGSGKGRMDEDLPSFSDLIRAQGQGGDDGITRMVSRVGRWWYSRCYESLVLPGGDITKSIWADDALVRECEKRGTSLKLMVCFAQKPDCPVRRTISV